MLEDLYEEIFKYGGKKKYQAGTNGPAPSYNYDAILEEQNQGYPQIGNMGANLDPYAEVPMTAGTTGTSGPVMSNDMLGAGTQVPNQNSTNLNEGLDIPKLDEDTPWDGQGPMPKLGLADLSQNQQQDIVVPEGIEEETPMQNMSSYGLKNKSVNPFPYINPGGTSLESRAYMLGRGLGAEKGPGKTLSIIGGIGSLGLGVARNVVSGAATQKRNDWVENEYRRKQQRDARKYQTAPQARNTNNISGQMFQDGGFVNDLKKAIFPEEYNYDPYVSEAFTGDPTEIYRDRKGLKPGTGHGDAIEFVRKEGTERTGLSADEYSEAVLEDLSRPMDYKSTMETIEPTTGTWTKRPNPTVFQDGGESSMNGMELNNYTEDDFLKDSTFLYEQTQPYAEKGSEYYQKLFEEDQSTWESEVKSIDRVLRSPEVVAARERVEKYKGYVPEEVIGTTTDPDGGRTYRGRYFTRPEIEQKEPEKPDHIIPKVTYPGAHDSAEGFHNYQKRTYNISDEEYQSALNEQQQRKRVNAAMKEEQELGARNQGKVAWTPELLRRELSKPNLDPSRRAELEAIQKDAIEQMQDGGQMGQPQQQRGNQQMEAQRQQLFAMAQKLIQEHGSPEAIAKFLQEQQVDPQVYEMIMQIVVGMMRQGSESQQPQQKKKGGKISI